MLLEQQQHLHDKEVNRWKDILGASVQLMEQVRLNAFFLLPQPPTPLTNLPPH